MLPIKLLIFVVLWSTTYAHSDDDANFERICVPNDVCYLVSKFRTGYRNAMHICSRKVKSGSKITERDKVILKPLSDQIRRHKYWILDAGSGSETTITERVRVRVRVRIRLRLYRRYGAIKIGDVKNINIKKIIIGIIVSFKGVLDDIQWEELVQYLAVRRRAKVIEKMRRFISFVENNDFDNLDIYFINFITKAAIQLESIRLQLTIRNSNALDRIRILLRYTQKYIKFLKLIKWSELVSHYDDARRLEIIRLVKTFFRYVKYRNFGRFNARFFNVVNEITAALAIQKIRLLFNHDTLDDNRRAKIDVLQKFIKILLHLNWEELVEQFEESHRAEIIERIRTFIKLVQDEEYDKINVPFINFVNHIITKLGLLRIRFVFNLQEHERHRAIFDTSQRFIRLLEQLEWAKHMQYFEESSRVNIIERIKLFLSLVQRKQWENLDLNLLNFINQIINKLGLVEIRQSCDCENREHEVNANANHFLEYLKFLISIKWENYLKFFVVDERTEIGEKIRIFIKLVENKEFDKVDDALHQFIAKIIIRFKKAKEQDDKDQNDKALKFTQLIKSLEEIKWEILIKHFEESQRADITEKIRTFIQLVQNKEFHKISAELHDFVNVIIVKLTKLKDKPVNDECVVENKNVRCIKLVEFLEQINWEKHVKYFEEGQRAEILDKVRAFIRLVQNKEFDQIKTDMYNYIEEIVKQFKKLKEGQQKEEAENVAKNEKFDQNLKLLEAIKWKELIQKIDEDKRSEIIAKIEKFRTLVQNKEYQNIDNDLFVFITEIIVKFKEISQTTVEKTVTQEVINKIQLNLPSNWILLLKRIPDIDHDLWVARITQLLERKNSQEYQEVKFDWVVELQKIIGLIAQEDLKFKKENAIDEQASADLIEKVNKLKEWKWDTRLIYFEEPDRKQIIKAFGMIFSAVENKKFQDLDKRTYQWFVNSFGIFAKINEAIESGHVYDSKTKIWVKKETVVVQEGRVKRLLRFRGRISTKTRTRIHGHSGGCTSCRSRCTYLENEDERLITKYDNCGVRQRFICKEQRSDE